MNPYSALPASAFWRSAVAEPDRHDIAGLWQPKFLIERADNVVTYGSCFAQHIGRALKARKYRWLSTENPPEDVSDETASEYNYRVFSSRTANIYTATLLLQWARWSFGKAEAPDEVWLDAGRAVDPFRPRIEPDGFASADEMRRMRGVTQRAFPKSVLEARYFVFTLGLTERWINGPGGYEYPMCPGTAGGRFDPEKHQFENLDYNRIVTALEEAFDIFRAANPGLRFILTVSPVPLTATASGQHVLTATTQSKSVLRAVAGHFADRCDDVDYFPSYEIITSPVFRGAFFEPNLRSVKPKGVDFVMNSFFRDMATKFGTGEAEAAPRRQSRPKRQPLADNADDLVCEEQLLAAFGDQK